MPLWALFIILILIIFLIVFVVILVSSFLTPFSNNRGKFFDINAQDRNINGNIMNENENRDENRDENNDGNNDDDENKDENRDENKYDDEGDRKDNPKKKKREKSDRNTEIIVVQGKSSKTTKNYGDRDLYNKLYLLLQQQQENIQSILNGMNRNITNALVTANTPTNYQVDVVAVDLPVDVPVQISAFSAMAVEEKGKIISSKLYNNVSPYNFTSKIVMDYISYVEHDAIFSISDQNTLWSEVKFGVVMILFNGTETIYNYRSNFSNDTKVLKILIEKTNLETLRLPVGNLKITFLLSKYISPYSLTLNPSEIYFFPQREIDFLSR